MSFTFGLNPVLLVVCLLAAAGLTYWTYRRPVPPLSRARRGVLMGLRFLALFIVLALLFQPILRRLERQEHAPLLAVLVDDSQSLSLTGGVGDTATADLRAVVRSTLQQLNLDDLGGEARFFSFSGGVAPLPRTTNWADSLGFEGARTNIGQALDFAREELQDENLRGVLLVSDGRYNTGRNPLYVAERYPVPIFTLVVGDTTSARDVQIRRVTTNEIAYVGVELPLQVGLRAEDYGDARVTVSLSQNGQMLASAPVQLPNGTAEVPVDLSFTPTQAGLQRLVVSVTRLPGEATYRNNVESVAVRVLESKKKILLLAAAPSPDVSAVRQLLETDPNAEVTSFVQKGPGSFYEGTFPPDLGAFDLIALVGFPGAGADAAVMRRLAQAAENGTPLFFILGRQTDLNALRQYFADVLPAAPNTVRQNWDEAVFDATETGVQHPILAIAEAPPPSWQLLPPLLFNDSRWQTSPDARVLATVVIRGVALDDPLFVIRQRAGSRAAALLAAGTWRWLNLPPDLDAADAFWPGLLANTIQWLSTPQDDRRVRVQPIAQVFAGGDAVSFMGQVYDESLQPVSDASVEVQVTTPDGTRFPYTMEAVGNGRYTLDVGALPEGTYRYTAEATREGRVLGEDSGTFAVGALTLEFKETRADAALMRQIAQWSGGAFLAPAEAGGFPRLLQASEDFAPIVIEEARETKLWHRYVFLLLVILFLAAEWVLRKRSGMV